MLQLDISGNSPPIELINDEDLFSVNFALCTELFDESENPQSQTEQWSWCAHKNSSLVEYFVIVLAVICFFYLVLCYSRIFLTISSNTVSKRRTSKMIATTCMLLGAFTLCYLPFMTFEFGMTIVTKNVNYLEVMSTSRSVLVIHNILNSLLLSYPLIDPIIYALRLPVVKKLVTFAFIFCFYFYLHFYSDIFTVD